MELVVTRCTRCGAFVVKLLLQRSRPKLSVHIRLHRERGCFSAYVPSITAEVLWVSVVGPHEDVFAFSHLDITHADIPLVGDGHAVGDYLTLVGEVVHVGVI